MKIVIITGSSEWTEREPIRLAISTADLVLLGGCNTGANQIAYELAIHNGIDVAVMVPKRTRPKSLRCHQHNRRMALFAAEQQLRANDVECYAFPLGESPGTRDCIELMREAGIKTTVFGSEPTG